MAKRRSSRWWIYAVVVFVVCMAGAVSGLSRWLAQPLALRTAGVPIDLRVLPRSSGYQVAQQMHAAGVDVPAWFLFAWLRLSGQARQIQAGSYEIVPGTTPRELLGHLVRGEQALRRVTLIEGWNYRQVLQALQHAPDLSWDLPANVAGQTLALLPSLGLGNGHPEGRFFPDTYLYPKHEKASVVLKQAAIAMDKQLEHAWAQRAANLPLSSPTEALILASLIEKETGHPEDRSWVAGVFVNRLRLGMRLQTDPSVIYGLGPLFEGTLRRRDLQTDTPYNTYTRHGLPPTPIAMPGQASLLAAVQPAHHPALYFVAKGDGRSEFNVSLAEHNRAVQRYILNR